MDHIDLGPIEGFTHCPMEVVVEGQPHFVVGGPKEFRLLSSVCPHMGGRVLTDGVHLECPNHGWQFNPATGQCIATPRSRLESMPIIERDGHLFVRKLTHTHRANSRIGRTVPSIDLTITLHAHACLEFQHRGFSLLTDPWLTGYAFLGSWMHYPPVVVKPASLRPNAIWLTHEHSDHLHLDSLNFFARDVPIYFPNYPNQRIQKILGDAGFTNLHCVQFGEEITLAPRVTLTCYEPGSMWNDSISLIKFDDFRFLNLSDAGLNHRIAELVYPVHALASNFSPGASGYPLTWTHLEDDAKDEMIRAARSGMLEMLKQAATMYGAEYIIPFACHITLGPPNHRSYVRQLRRNTVMDAVLAFSDSDRTVLDLLAGESWNAKTRVIKRVWQRREDLYRLDRIEGWIDQTFDRNEFDRFYPVGRTVTVDEVARYVDQLNFVPEIALCDDVVVALSAMDQTGNDLFTLGFAVRAGRISRHYEPVINPEQVIRIPLEALAAIVLDGVSWDEAIIGYWCLFYRRPDVYNAGFWRLLQAPYFKKHGRPYPADRSAIHSGSIVAELLEQLAQDADRILRRYGLYCTGCHRSSSETLGQAARTHGVTETRLERLLLEMNGAFSSVPEKVGAKW